MRIAALGGEAVEHVAGVVDRSGVGAQELHVGRAVGHAQSRALLPLERRLVLGDEGPERGAVPVVGVGNGRDDHIHGFTLPGLRHGGLDEAGEALTVPGPVAVEHLVDLGPAHEQVDIVLPRETDATVQLERLAAEVGEGVVDIGPGGGHRLVGVGQTVTEGQGGIVGRGPHALELDQQVGQPVLDGLEAADGPPELHALLGVVHGRVEEEVGGADGLGRLQHGGHRQAPLHHGPAACELGRAGNGDAVEADLGEAAGQVEAREHTLGQARGRAGHEQVDDAVAVRLLRRDEQQGCVACAVDVAGHAVEAPAVAGAQSPAPPRRTARGTRRRSGTRRTPPRPARSAAGAPWPAPRSRSGRWHRPPRCRARRARD